ncbi:MAG: arylamine N-acetyltransferase [Propionibacteriales bacterium]|nr:arylamine N-acetyltransferase [Propionibacteriales bacterium]
MRAGRPDAAYLRELQLRHLRSVPFESLSIHLGERIVLDVDALLEKIVGRRRGGFCYELNGLFERLLTALGYDVTMHSASVFGGDSPGPPFDHLVLRVTAEGRAWLVDVGFGAFAHHPLLWDERGDQTDPGGVYRIDGLPDGDLVVHQDREPEYRIEVRPRALTDFVPTCWWQQTSPDSHFTQSPVCSMLTDTGRVTLRGRTLIETRADGRSETEVEDDRRLLDLYGERFGIVLDRVPLPPDL